jgi:hypothetical protein
MNSMNNGSHGQGDNGNHGQGNNGDNGNHGQGNNGNGHGRPVPPHTSGASSFGRITKLK